MLGLREEYRWIKLLDSQSLVTLNLPFLRLIRVACGNNSYCIFSKRADDLKIHFVLFLYLLSSNILSNLHLILEGCVSPEAQGKCLVHGSHSRWCLAEQQKFSSCIKVCKTLHILVSFTTQSTYLPHNVNSTFFLMCHIWLKLQGTVYTPLAGGLEMFTQDACRTMTNICCGVLLHQSTIVTRRGPFNIYQKLRWITSNSSFGKMKISYAIQVFSKSMTNTPQYFHPNGEGHELAKFIGMVNDFFDMANVRSVQ